MATTGQATSVGATTAILNGTVNPGGVDTSVHFEYGTSSTSLSSTTLRSPCGSGSSDVPVTAALKGLKPSQSYWFRVVATNSSGTTNGALSLFTTGEATLATTGQASPVASTIGDAERHGEPGRAEDELLLRVRHLGHEPHVQDGEGRCRLRLDRRAGELGAVGAEGGHDLLLPPGRDELGRDEPRAAIASLTTAAAAVSATTGQATTVGSTTAEVTGSVNPGGLTTSYWFEYGTSSFAASDREGERRLGLGLGVGDREADGAEAGHGLHLPAGRVELVRLEHGRPVELHDEHGRRADGVDRLGLGRARRPA